MIRTCDYDAGAICSLTWNGQQFIDDYDHGRQLQSAVTFRRSRGAKQSNGGRKLRGRNKSKTKQQFIAVPARIEGCVDYTGKNVILVDGYRFEVIPGPIYKTCPHWTIGITERDRVSDGVRDTIK